MVVTTVTVNSTDCPKLQFSFPSSRSNTLIPSSAKSWEASKRSSKSVAIEGEKISRIEVKHIHRIE